MKVWWKCCDCGHEWQTTLGLRTTAGTGCAPCSYKQRGQKRRTPKPGQSLADLFPELVEEWDWNKNGDLDPAELKPGSDLSVWWVCRRGHEWQVNIYTRAGPQRTGCFKCVHMPEEGESFADLNPSAENIAIVIYNILRNQLSEGLDLKIRLYETERNFVEYPVA